MIRERSFMVWISKNGKRNLLARLVETYQDRFAICLCRYGGGKYDSVPSSLSLPLSMDVGDRYSFICQILSFVNAQI